MIKTKPEVAASLSQGLSRLVLCFIAIVTAAPAQHLVPRFQAQVTNIDMKTVIGDINGNGMDDLVGSIYLNSFAVCVDPWINGLGTWVPLAIAGEDPVLADVNNDGIDDMLFASMAQTIEVVLGSNTGVLNAPTVTLVPATAIPGGAYASFSVADVNNDGFPDIVRGVGSFLSTATAMEVWLSTGPFTYTLTSTLLNATQGGFVAPVFEDFDGDGNSDFVMLRQPVNPMPGPNNVFSDIVVAYGFGNGQFSPFNVIANNLSFGPTSVIYGPRGTGDFTGNGLPDLLFSELIGGVTPELSFIPARSGGGFGVPQRLGIPSDPRIPYYFATGDLDGDGNPEILYGEQKSNIFGGNADARMHVLKGLGAGLFRPSRTLSSVPGGDQWAPHLGDFRGTGVRDVIVKSRGIFGGQISTYVYLENQTVISAGCPGSTGLMTMLPDNAAPGNATFALSLLGAPAGRQAIAGLSLGRVPLSNPCAPVLDLSPPNLLLPQGGFGLLSTSANGSATLPLPIPNLPAILGLSFYAQWAVDDPSGTLSLSEARTFVVW